MTWSSATKNEKGISLIEIMIASQIIIIVVGLLSLAYAFLLGEWQGTRDEEKILLYEREFLRYFSADVEVASSARHSGNYLYLEMLDGTSQRYNYKPSAKRIDRGIDKDGSENYLGRVTAGMVLDDFRYNIYDHGLEIIYRVSGSAERRHYYRFNGL